MLSAHISYWQSSSFATFVLLQLFSDFQGEKETPTIVPAMDPRGRPGKGEEQDAKDNNHSDDGEEEEAEDGEISNDNGANERLTTLGRIFSAISPSAIM